MSSAKLKGGDGLDDIEEIGDVSPDLKKDGTIPIKAKGKGGGSTVIIEQNLDDISEEEDDYEESYDDEEEEDATRESKEKSKTIIVFQIFSETVKFVKDASNGLSCEKM
jgi:hypothetical protein